MRIAPLAYTSADDDEVRAASAITHAHRTSTESCVCVIAGAVYGYRAIPAEWLEALRGKDIIEPCLFPGFESVRS